MMTNGSATAEFHKQTYGEDFQYQEFAPMFKAELFNPDEWANLFKNSGAKYVVLTSKHHGKINLTKITSLHNRTYVVFPSTVNAHIGQYSVKNRRIHSVEISNVLELELSGCWSREGSNC
jgi:hypothetical protein